MGSPSEAEPGIWTLSEKLEPTMRALGERGDIVKAMQPGADRARPGARDGPLRPPRRGGSSGPIIGRVIGKRLTDELGDRLALIVDGVDGRAHHVALGDKAVGRGRPIGAIVEIGRAPAGLARSDRNIAVMAEETGVYRPSEHRAIAEAGQHPRAGRRL